MSQSQEPSAQADPAGERPKRRIRPTVTRERIVRAAYDEFAENGYDGARIDRIVERAEISKNLLYHHFSGKEELFVRVMEIVYQEMRLCHQDLELVDLDPRVAMARLVSHTFKHFVDTPHAVSLMNSENLHRAAHIRKSKLIRNMYNPLLDNITRILSRGQAAGYFRDNVDPIDLYISISGLGYFFLANQHTLGTIFNRKLTTAQGIRARHDHIVEMVLAYLHQKEPLAKVEMERSTAQSRRRARNAKGDTRGG